ncbi:MAG: hypothetical protein KF729_07635 [Sandaracinaceae bacterium]|nr:hypothetical protein [Sandaracinaceae bacterium]
MTYRQTMTLVGALALAGCAMTHGEVDHDAGRSTPTADGGPRADAAACPSGLTPLDSLPQHFDAHHGPLSIATDGATFWIAHFHGNPSPCDGPCLGLRALAASGPIGEFGALYWLYEADFEPALEVVSGVGRMLATAVDRRAAWQAWPVGPEPWRADASFHPPEGETVVSVAPRRDGGVDLLLRGAPRGDVPTRVVSLGPTGDVIDDRAGPRFPTVLELRLVPSRGGARWIAAVEDWDFPATVRIDRVEGPRVDSFHGARCGENAFDARELDDARVVLAQRCGRMVWIEARGDGGRAEPTTVTEAAAQVTPAVAVLERGREVVVGYALEGADAPTLERLRLGDDGRFRSIARVTAPADPLVRLPIAALDVEALDDGTIALAWRGRVPPEEFIASDGAVARFAPCD